MPNISLRLLVLKTLDVEQLCRFYESLGLRFTEEHHGNGPVHYSAPLGDGIIEIYPLPADKQVDQSARLGFAIDDPDSAVKKAETLGGRVVRDGADTPWGYMAIVGDPDGRIVELYRS